MSKSYEVICITDKDCARYGEFTALMAATPGGRLIDFYTMDLEELAIIAKHRIMPVPTIIVLTTSNNKVAMRMVNPPKAEALADIIQSLPALL